MFSVSERVLGAVFLHRHVDNGRHSGGEELENISKISADLDVPLHDTPASFHGTDEHEQLNFETETVAETKPNDSGRLRRPVGVQPVLDVKQKEIEFFLKKSQLNMIL